MTECEAALLGREPIHGSANATALATLVKTLMRKSELHRKYVLRCNRDNGLQMIPHRRLEDEGFESDEDVASLGSFEDGSSSIYVSDHALRVKCRNGAAGPPKSSQSPNAAAAATSGSVSSVGTDSANSSGASDNDETDNSSSHNVNHKGGCEPYDKKKGVDDVESFAFHEVAFCHTDPSLPKVIVWVVKTKRPSSKSTNEYSYGLEAIVFLCQSDEKFRTLYKSFQELSRRQKLEKPVRNRWKEEFKPTGYVRKCVVATSRATATTTTTTAAAPEKLVAKSATRSGGNNATMFNLVQRVDTDGVTHIEVTRPPAAEARLSRMLSDSGEPSSIISINTPDAGDVKTIPKKSDKLIESVIRAEDKEAPAPERPERKKHAAGKDAAASIPPVDYAPPNREKVVRGQYVRVSVDPKTLSSPSSRGGWLFSEAKPCANVLSYPARLVWSRHEKDDHHHEQSQLRRGRRTEPAERERERRHRSKSSVILRRGESPKRYPMPHRYADAIQINNSLPNRFFGRLKELAAGANQGGKFKRRNSIGDLTNAGNYQHADAKKFDKNHSLAKSTPNLKSMIKNKNGKYCKDGYNENEPKKVTFSAYATVQVVD